MSDPETLRRAFIIELSVNGLQLADVPLATLKEAARVAIFERSLARLRFQDSALLYSEAYREAFGETLERRAKPRPLPDEAEMKGEAHE